MRWTRKWHYLALRCDVLVGACVREQTDHFLARLLRCDAQGSGTTLHWVVCLLSDAGADKGIAMQGGATSLFVTFQKGRQEVVRLFSDAGADKDIAMQGGATHLFMASQQGHL